MTCTKLNMSQNCFNCVYLRLKSAETSTTFCEATVTLGIEVYDSRTIGNVSQNQLYFEPNPCDADHYEGQIRTVC